MSVRMLNPADVSRFLRGLRQRRKYSNERIPDEILTDILDVARWTGSAKNTQPWDFVVVRDKERLKAISEAGTFAGFLAGVDVAIVLVLQPTASAYDEGRASERIMLIADAYGLSSGTGWFGGAEGSGRVKQLLGIPDEMIARSAVGLGYPDLTVDDRPPVTLGRRPLQEVVSYEQYGQREP